MESCTWQRNGGRTSRGFNEKVKGDKHATGTLSGVQLKNRVIYWEDDRTEGREQICSGGSQADHRVLEDDSRS